jgi:hypothetical protein
VVVLGNARSRRSGRPRPPGSALLALFGAAAALLGAGAPGEYEVKAAFLYNFAKFVEWPEGALEQRDRFTICVVGTSDVSEQLKRVVEGRNVSGLAVAVRTLEDADSDADCQMLFAPGNASARSITEKASSGVLTVGEYASFARDGGMINFVFIDKKVRFEINRKRAEESGLAISSKLLKLAHDVYE